jgi:hypothetical protein
VTAKRVDEGNSSEQFDKKWSGTRKCIKVRRLVVVRSGEMPIKAEQVGTGSE